MYEHRKDDFVSHGGEKKQTNKKALRMRSMLWVDAQHQGAFVGVHLDGLPCFPSPAQLGATQSRCTASAHKTPSV